MMKRTEFINKSIDLVKKELEETLPKEDRPLDEMFSYLEKVFKKILKGF